MLDVLYKVEKELPRLLREKGIWTSLYIDYHPPIVERLWTQWKEYRVYLHRIHKCKPKEALFHPHPWPQAVRVLSGKYEMGVGFGKGQIAPPVSAKIIVDSGFCYEMTHKDGWHYVRPIDPVTISIQVTGKPWKRSSPKSNKPLKPLNDKQVAEMISYFKKIYN